MRFAGGGEESNRRGRLLSACFAFSRDHRTVLSRYRLVPLHSRTFSTTIPPFLPRFSASKLRLSSLRFPLPAKHLLSEGVKTVRDSVAEAVVLLAIWGGERSAVEGRKGGKRGGRSALGGPVKKRRRVSKGKVDRTGEGKKEEWRKRTQ